MNYLKFVRDNMPKRLRDAFSTADEIHIGECLQILDRHINGTMPACDDFIEAIANRDFYTALQLADDVNQSAMFIYGCFMYNHAPAPTK